MELKALKSFETKGEAACAVGKGLEALVRHARDPRMEMLPGLHCSALQVPLSTIADHDSLKYAPMMVVET